MKVFLFLFVFFINSVYAERLRATHLFEVELSVSSSIGVLQVTNIEFENIDPYDFCKYNGLVSKASILAIRAPYNSGWFARITDWDGQTLPGENWKLQNLNDKCAFLYFNLRADHDPYGRVTSLKIIDGKTDEDPQGSVVQEQTVILDSGYNHRDDCNREILLYGYILPNQLHKAVDGIYYKVLNLELWSY